MNHARRHDTAAPGARLGLRRYPAAWGVIQTVLNALKLFQ